MEPTMIFASILAFDVASFLWDFYLDYRQYTLHKANVKRPEAVAELISEEDYTRARNYELDKHHFGFVEDLFDNTKSIALLVFFVLPWFWDLVGQWSLALWSNGGEIWHSVMFLVISSAIESVEELPFAYYSTFVIEQKHGFNKQTRAFFFTDRLKKFAVGQAISVPVIATIVYIVKHIGGRWFFFYVWLFVTIVVFVMMTIYPEFIAPLFDKYTPLPESELKTRIEQLASRVAFPLTKIYVVQGSKRSAHSNAYMYGFWKNKRIVLYDTLLSPEMNDKLKEINGETAPDGERSKGMSDDEVLAVLGHELGHWKLYHTVLNLALAEANMLLMLSLFGYLYRQDALYTAFGFTTQPVVIGLMIIMSFIAAPYNELVSVATSYMSRKMEFAADRFSAGLGQSEKLCSSLIKLEKDNLGLPIDDWLYSAINHSHPPISERVAALKKYV